MSWLSKAWKKTTRTFTRVHDPRNIARTVARTFTRTTPRVQWFAPGLDPRGPMRAFQGGGGGAQAPTPAGTETPFRLTAQQQKARQAQRVSQNARRAQRLDVRHVAKARERKVLASQRRAGEVAAAYERRHPFGNVQS